MLFFFFWVAKYCQVSEAVKLVAIPWPQRAEAFISLFISWHALYCSILASSNTGRHLSIEMNQPGEAPLALGIMQRVTGAMFH